MNMLSDIWHRTEEWLKEGLDELRIVTIIFLGITIIGALLLMTPLPKTVVLWSSFVASVMIPVFMVSLEKRTKKLTDGLKSNESINFLLHGYYINNYLHQDRAESHPLENLCYSLPNSMYSNHSFDLINQEIHGDIRTRNILVIQNSQNSISNYMQSLLRQLTRTHTFKENEFYFVINNLQEIAMKQKVSSLPDIFSGGGSAKKPLKDFNPISTNIMRF